VHHRAVCTVDGRPYRGLVIGRLLEHDVDGSLGSGEYRRSRLLVTDGLAEQLRVELRQAAGVRSFDSGLHHMPSIRERTLGSFRYALSVMPSTLPPVPDGLLPELRLPILLTRSLT
jgi:hypothetical protein